MIFFKDLVLTPPVLIVIIFLFKYFDCTLKIPNILNINSKSEAILKEIL